MGSRLDDAPHRRPVKYRQAGVGGQVAGETAEHTVADGLLIGHGCSGLRRFGLIVVIQQVVGVK